jgi:hypothetical protein
MSEKYVISLYPQIDVVRTTSRTESSSTVASMTPLVVKMSAILSWRAMISIQKKSPINTEVVNEFELTNDIIEKKNRGVLGCLQQA